MTQPRSLKSLLLAAGFGLFAACSSQSAMQQSRDYARLGAYQRAFEVLDEAYRRQSADGDVDQDLAEAHEVARRVFLLERARRKIFQEKEDEALLDLDALASVAPDYPELAALQARAMRKKAIRIVLASDGLFSEKDYAGAMQGYLEAQRLVPDLALADEGIAKVREEMALLDARAQQQFLEAVRKVPEFRYVEVQWHAANVIHNTPDREEAKELRLKARHVNALGTFERAKECERADQFGAALLLYRAARELDPELEGVEQAIDTMKQELEALGMIEQAQLAMRSDKFDEADELLKTAHDMSTLSRGTISELMIQARKMRGEQRYQEARDLEVLGKKAEALAAFEAIAAEWPEGIKDEQARIDGLKVDVAGAATEWAAAEEAEAAGDLPKALDHYINAERFYPGYRDGAERIERLRKAIADG